MKICIINVSSQKERKKTDQCKAGTIEEYHMKIADNIILAKQEPKLVMVNIMLN